MKQSEREANQAIQLAVQALVRALELSEQSGYGSQVLVPLTEALKESRYALDTALGRN